MSFNTKIFSLILTICVAALSAQGVPVYCPRKCAFTFYPAQGPFKLGTHDVALTSQIVSRNNETYIGAIGATGEAYISENKTYIPISSYKLAPQVKKFSPSFFKAYSIVHVKDGKKHYFSGVGHEKLAKGQSKFLHGKTVILPLTQYQILDAPMGNVTRNVWTNNNFVDCASFTIL